MDRPDAAPQRIFLSSTDHSLHPVDSSLRNVERADQYVLIVNDRDHPRLRLAARAALISSSI